VAGGWCCGPAPRRPPPPREAYVLAGGVSEAGELLAAPTRTSLEESLTARTFRPMPPVMVATLGSNAGIAGAADLAGTD